MSRADLAVALFQAGFSCSQAVLAAYAPELGLDRDLALKVAGAFGGGMGRLGEVCGAVTGAFMAVGLLHGRTRADDQETKERAYALVADLGGQFRRCHGSLLCRELLGCDLGTPEGRQYAADQNLSATLCIHFVRTAAEALESLLSGQQAPASE